MDWEQIETAHVTTGQGVFGTTTKMDVLLSRAPVPGGWLVLAVSVGSVGYPVSVTFYPDPAHAWDAGLPPRA